MKKMYKIVVMIFMILFLGACGEDVTFDQVKDNYKNVLEKNPVCSYEPTSGAPQGITKVTYEANLEGAFVTYKLGGKDYNKSLFNDKGKFDNDYFDAGGISIKSDINLLSSMFDEYGTSSKCLEQIYVCSDGASGYIVQKENIDTSCFEYASAEGTKPPSEKTDKTESTDKDGCTHNTASCQNSYSVYCEVEEVKEHNVIIERGEDVNGNYYVWIWRGETKNSTKIVLDAKNDFFNSFQGIGDVWRVPTPDKVFKKENCKYPKIYVSDGGANMNNMTYYIQAEDEDPYGFSPTDTATEYDPYEEEYAESGNQEIFGNAGNVTNPPATGIDLCSRDGAKQVLHIIGYLLFSAKIAVPLLLIVMGSMDFGKALTSSDDKAMKDAFAKLIKRVVAGVIIFFIPTVFDFLLGLVDGASNNQTNFTECSKCLFTPISGECTYTKIGSKNATTSETPSESEGENEHETPPEPKK